MRSLNAIYSGLIRLHVLHHASKETIFGLGIIEELGRHGYRLSAGTLYPLLHSLEREGYLRSLEERNGSRSRRLYKATPKGRKALREAKGKVRELFAELFEDQ
ncbi:MAG: PadR family transcriptional regulator [Candidatus Binataceae bacterium]